MIHSWLKIFVDIFNDASDCDTGNNAFASRHSSAVAQPLELSTLNSQASESQVWIVWIDHFLDDGMDI